MANEISISTTLTALKGKLSLSKQSSGNADLTTATYSAAAASIPTTAGGTALALGSVSTCGYTYLRNTDDTNFVTVGIVVSATYYPVLKLKPGEQALCRLGTNAPYARADTAAVVLDYVILSD